MPSPYDTIPAPTRERLLEAGRGLGELDRILDDKADPDADLEEHLGLGVGVVGLLLCLTFPFLTRALGWFTLGQLAGPIMVLVGLWELLRRARRLRRNRRRCYVGLFEAGLAEVRFGSDAAHVVRFHGARADVKTAWNRAPRGSRAERCTLTVSDARDAITYVAANDAAYFELNAILRRLPGMKPVQRDKEPRYRGD